MVETILLILLLFPSMLGLAEIIHMIKLYILLPKVKPQKAVIVYLNGEKSVEQLQFVIQEYLWYGEKYAKKIAAVDKGIPEDLVDKCVDIAVKNDIILCLF